MVSSSTPRRSSGQDNATAGDLIVMVVLIAIPVIAALPVTAWVQGRRLEPLLKGLPLTAERITIAEINQSAKNASTIKVVGLHFICRCMRRRRCRSRDAHRLEARLP
jgi:hypothetical protein